MSKIDLIKKIEANRGSKVITYITSDRQGHVNARVAMDIIPEGISPRLATGSL